MIWPPPPPVAETISDAEGWYSMRVPATIPIPSRAIAAKEGYYPQMKLIEMLPAGGLRIDFHLIPSTEPTPSPTLTPAPTPTGLPEEPGICGLVVEKSMLTVIIPIPGAVVEAYPAMILDNAGGGMISTDPDATWPPEPVATAVTDENGRFPYWKLGV